MTFVRTLEDTLRELGTPERAEHEKKYLKSTFEHYGVPVPLIRSTVKVALRDEDLDERKALLRHVIALWNRPVHECRFAAVEMLDQRSSLLEVSDMPLIETMIRESKTWALVDTLCTRVAGVLVEQNPALTVTLDRWSKDEDFWVRRASMLSLLVPLRKGEGDFQRFGRYADTMLDDKEFFIRKAIGWVLREVANKRPKMVIDWLRPRAKLCSGLTFREATRKLSVTQRKALEAQRNQ
jgi:3-methyladenine DNA glycosylase AlkD